MRANRIGRLFIQSDGDTSMAFKDLLLTVTTCSKPTPASAVDTSVAFATAVGAKISVIVFEIEFQMPWSPFYKAFPEIPALAGFSSRVHGPRWPIMRAPCFSNGSPATDRHA